MPMTSSGVFITVFEQIWHCSGVSIDFEQLNSN